MSKVGGGADRYPSSLLHLTLEEAGRAEKFQMNVFVDHDRYKDT